MEVVVLLVRDSVVRLSVVRLSWVCASELEVVRYTGPCDRGTA